MTEIRDAQHFSVDLALINEQIAKAREALIEKQMAMYPDSRIMTDDEVIFEWLAPAKDQTEQWTKWSKEETKEAFEGVDTNDMYYRLYKDRKYLEYKANYLRSIGTSVAISMATPVHVFYECCKDEKGVYKFRGCRDGLESQDYRSGFMKF